MKLPELKRMVAIWTERLSLNDWILKVRFATPEEEENGWGFCLSNAHTKEAEIVLVNPAQYAEEDTKDVTKDIEVFIVHELSHLHFVNFATEEGSALETLEENIVSMFSRLLIAIDRRDESVIGRKLSKRATLNPKKDNKSKHQESAPMNVDSQF